MGSRWAMLGSALGQGITAGLEPYLQLKMQERLAPLQANIFAETLRNKVAALKGDEEKKIKGIDLSGLSAPQLSLLGVNQSQTDPLSLLLYQILGGQGLDQSQTNNIIPPPSGNTIPPKKSGVSYLIEQDQKQSSQAFGGADPANLESLLDNLTKKTVFRNPATGIVYDETGMEIQ